jgi:hypothetical protein
MCILDTQFCYGSFRLSLITSPTHDKNIYLYVKWLVNN